MSERRGILVPGPVVVEERVLYDATAAVTLERQRHGVTEQAGGPPDRGVVVGIDRVVVRRHEEAGSPPSHLMHGQEDLRVPAPVEEIGHGAVLSQVQHERVAIDVVAGVAVVEPGHRRVLERRAAGLLEPVDDELVAVRVEGRDQQDHGLPQERQRGGIGRRSQLVQQLVRGLGGANLRRVDAHPDGDDCRLRLEEASGLGGRERPRIGQSQTVGPESRSSRSMFSGEEMAAAIRRSPSVVGPMSKRSTRSDASAIVAK